VNAIWDRNYEVTALNNIGLVRATGATGRLRSATLSSCSRSAGDGDRPVRH